MTPLPSMYLLQLFLPPIGVTTVTYIPKIEIGDILLVHQSTWLGGTYICWMTAQVDVHKIVTIIVVKYNYISFGGYNHYYM